MEDINDVDVEDLETETPPENSEHETSVTTPAEKTKFVRLPLARVKHIMKMDPDCNLISQDALFLITKSTVIHFN